MAVPLCAELPLNNHAPDPFRDVAQRARAMGLDGVMLDFMPDLPEDVLLRARDVFEQHALMVAELGCYVNLIDPDEQRQAASVERMNRALQQAEILGARCVATVAGSLVSGNMSAPHRDNWSSLAWERLDDALRRIVPIAEETGVFMCMEPFILTNLDSPAALRRVIDEHPSPALGVLLDPVNLVTRERYFHTGTLIDEAFDLLGDRIRCAHAKDTLWIPGALTLYLQEVVPGQGVLDYARFLHRLDHVGNGIPLCIEHLDSDRDYVEAAAYIRTVATREGIALRRAV